MAAGTLAVPTLGTGFVIAAEGESCPSTCAAAGNTAAFLNDFYTDASTYLCATNFLAQGWIAGYQQADAVCSTTFQGNAVDSISYACLCLTAQQTPGLEPSTGASSCESTCAQTLYGQVGTAVRPDESASSYTCLDSTEAGIGNRFGFADASTTATGTTDTAATPCVTANVATSTTYSCFCTFEAAAASTTSSTPSSAVATAGRKLLL